MLKKTLLISLTFLLFSCNTSVSGEGQPDFAQDYGIDNFHKIKALGSFKLLLIPNDTAYVSVQTHKNLIENISIENDKGLLKITEKKPVSKFEEYVVYAYYKGELKELMIGEKVLVETQDKIRSEEFSLEVSDEAIVRQFELETDEAVLNAEDKTEVTLEGETTDLEVEATDHAKITLKHFKAENVEVDLSDNSEVFVYAEDELEGVVNHNAILYYKGNPDKDVDLKDKGKMNNK